MCVNTFHKILHPLEKGSDLFEEQVGLDIYQVLNQVLQSHCRKQIEIIFLLCNPLPLIKLDKTFGRRGKILHTLDLL